MLPIKEYNKIVVVIAAMINCILRFLMELVQ